MKKILLLLVVLASIAAACGDSSSEGGSTADYCKFAKDAQASEALFDESDFSPGSVEEAFTEIYKLTQQAVKIAPAEIKADMKTMNDQLGEIVAALEAADWNLLAAPAALEMFEDFEFNAASDRVEAFDEANCG